VKKLLALAFLIICFSQNLFAQCAACKAAAESSVQSGSSSALGLNGGILYLMVIPYALVGIIGYYWYSKNKKQTEED
jgi:hypothetical protein